jgi:hypothetical protein
MSLGWKLLDKYIAHQEAQERRAWQWIKDTYEGELVIHTPTKSIHSVKSVAFNPTERRHLPFYKHPRANGYMHVTLRKAMSIAVGHPEVKTFELIQDSNATLPWIQATLRKRGPKRETAWALGIRNAAVVAKTSSYEGDSFFHVYCEEITELVAKSLEPVPLHLQV